MQLKSHATTHIGLKRKSNQDSFIILPEQQFFMVADGMGGHKGGDFASQFACATFEKLIQQTANADLALLQKAMQLAHTGILQKGRENPQLEGMGTTIVVGLFKEEKLIIGNVGDSRAYFVHQAQIFQLTKDHSLVQEKIEQNYYSREEAASDPMKNVLTRSVGHEDILQPDFYTITTRPGDLFLFCSDGLHGKVPDSEMLHEINKYLAKSEETSLENLGQVLVDKALTYGGNDNITLAIVHRIS